MAQVTSGTLAYAVAVGKPVISTPYVHASEILADGHGLVVPPANPQALAEAAIKLLSDDNLRRSISRAAYRRGREMLWPRVVERSLAPLPRQVPRGISRVLPMPPALPLKAVCRIATTAIASTIMPGR
jgi:hypothetical protein